MAHLCHCMVVFTVFNQFILEFSLERLVCNILSRSQNKKTQK